MFHDIEQRLRQVILDHGGSLSHHHGVGKIRQRFLTQVHSGAALEVIRSAKDALDPRNVFGIANGGCAYRPRGAATAVTASQCTARPPESALG